AVAEALAGAVCGFALAIIAAPLAAIALTRARVSSRLLRQIAPEGTSLVAIFVALHGLAFLAFTAIGGLLGLALAGLEERSPDGGLGSPNQSFTAFILIATAILFGPPLVALPKLRLPVLAAGVAFAGCFGWAMPYLSLLGPES
ncbi:MAG: hypothetical protein HY723_01790, partial [Chloroflexi bacterium]|nr:hypothetical protein [Chloroflexota bacterium]